MPRLWQYQSRVLDLLPPITHRSGWEVISTYQSRLARAAVGWELYSRPSPSAIQISWLSTVPDRSIRIRSVEGVVLQPPSQVAAATAQNPLGFPPIYLDIIRRRLPTIDALLPPQNTPPASTATNPIGWSATGLDQVKRLLTPPDSYFQSSDKPPASTATNPIGWRIAAPRRSFTRSGAANFYFQPTDKPPASVATNPTGWQPNHIDNITYRLPTLSYFHTPPTEAISNPLGWVPLFEVSTTRHILKQELVIESYFPTTPVIAASSHSPFCDTLVLHPLPIPDALVLPYDISSIPISPIGWQVRVTDKTTRLTQVTHWIPLDLLAGGLLPTTSWEALWVTSIRPRTLVSPDYVWCPQFLPLPPPPPPPPPPPTLLVDVYNPLEMVTGVIGHYSLITDMYETVRSVTSTTSGIVDITGKIGRGDVRGKAGG